MRSNSRWILLLFISLASTAQAQRDVFTTNTSYEVVGATSRMGMDAPYTRTIDEYVVHSDALVRTDGRYVYVLNRLFADNVLVLDAADDYSVVNQYSVTSVGLNPSDLVVVSPHKAYISLYESNSVMICHPLTGAVLGTIDLSGFADADGKVEMDQMARVGDLVFVALQNLDRRVVPWAMTGTSMLVVIDSVTDTVIDVDPDMPGVQGIALTAQNPYWRMHFDGRLGRLLLVASGSFLARDGGLEVVNPFSLQSEGLMISEAALSAELLDFALVNDQLAWALVNDELFNTCLVRFDPSTGTRLDTVDCTNGFLFSDLELALDGRLFVSDRTASAPGIRIYDAETAVLLAGPLDVGLPPFDLVLIEGVPTAVPATPSRSARLSASPNPFNPRVEIRLQGSASAVVELEIYDARGRRVRVLGAWLPAEDGVVWVWDGRDGTGEELPSGVYHARAKGTPAGAIALTLLR